MHNNSLINVIKIINNYYIIITKIVASILLLYLNIRIILVNTYILTIRKYNINS
jgi:hypothetical protein